MKNIKKEQKFAHSTYVYAGFLFVALFFVGSRFYPIMTKIKINTSSIKDGEVVNNGIVKILGRAKKATNLYINGKSTSVTKNGEFEDAIALPNGYNIVTITAVDKFGKASSETMKVSVVDGEIGTVTKLDNNNLLIN
jgi:hypothetical protein